MQLRRVLQQEIAVFGESGSGKTVLVSSFYGSMQEPAFLKESLYDVTADDTGLGQQLFKNYLDMRDEARKPASTPPDFSASYGFTLTITDNGPQPSKSFDAVRLVWHDYPGEWWEEDEENPAIAQQRVATFSPSSDLTLGDLARRWSEVAGLRRRRRRYLMLLFGSFRTGLLRLKAQLLEGGELLVKFPRIWILALSKADLLPEVDVLGCEISSLARLPATLTNCERHWSVRVDSPNALAVGEDFIRLSSAKLEPDRIKVTERIGVDLVLPVARGHASVGATPQVAPTAGNHCKGRRAIRNGHRSLGHRIHHKGESRAYRRLCGVGWRKGVVCCDSAIVALRC